MAEKESSKGVSSYWAKHYGNGKDASTGGASGSSTGSSSKKDPKGKSGKKARKKRRKFSQYSRSDKRVMIIGGLIILLILIWPVKRVIEVIDQGPSSGDSIPEGILKGSYSYGIDISVHNGDDIIWDSLYVMVDPSGHTTKDLMSSKEIFPVDFVFMKATEAVTFVDNNFKDNWENAGKVNIKRGAYHFFRTNYDPATQAENFIRTVGTMRYKDLPPVLDIEDIHKGCTNEQLNAACRKWLEIVEKHYGKKPIIYTYESFAKNHLSQDLINSYPLWIAHYETPYPMRDDWEYWQLSCKAVIYGIKGKVDLDVKKR